jgi:cellulose synthase/poly-beta-1,6-N-acetylglucosamine synthase-like glycosyltransferase
MGSILDWSTEFPVFLIAIVFANRYFFGIFLTKIDRTIANRPPNALLPSVCVIIPLYNEGKSIYNTLKSLTNQTYPRDLLRIIVVDDCSSDDSNAWATKAANEDPRIEVHRNHRNMGKRLGIARAVRRTEAEIIVSVDSDVIVSPSAVAALIKRFDDPLIVAVGGRVYVSNASENWLTKMQSIKYYFGYEYLKNVERYHNAVLCLSGCLTAYRKRVLIELEPILENRNILGIPIKYGEDRFLTRQIVKAGYKTNLELSAECYTKAPATLSGYFSQQLRWRRSNIVDFMGGIFHIFRLPPFVVVHYLSLNAILLCYPLILWMHFLSDSFWQALAFHLGILAIFGAIYGWSTRDYPRDAKVAPINFLWMGIIMPVTYMVISILALFTLDSGSWETRGKATVSKPAKPPREVENQVGYRVNAKSALAQRS